MGAMSDVNGTFVILNVPPGKYTVRASIVGYTSTRVENVRVSIDLTTTVNPTDRGPGNPFRQAHYLLLNLAIGGHSGGDPSNTEFPTRYENDYVRVYQDGGPVTAPDIAGPTER